MCELHREILPPFDRPAEPPSIAKAMAALWIAKEAFCEAVADLKGHRCWRWRPDCLCDWCVALEQAIGSAWSCDHLVLWIEGETTASDRAEAVYAAMLEAAERVLADAPAFGGKRKRKRKPVRRAVAYTTD